MIIAIVEFQLRPGAELIFEEALKKMRQRVKLYDGFLGEASFRSLDDEQTALALFYWRDRESMKAWRKDTEHRETQQLGREECFASYKIQICELEREYKWARKKAGA